MNANELRVWNYLQDSDGNVYKVDFTTFSKIAMLKSIGKKDEEFLFGIPLTPEILEKAGFELVPQRQSIYQHKRLRLALGNGCIAYLRNEDDTESHYILAVNYLHQLQNLYFALIGEELEVNL